MIRYHFHAADGSTFRDVEGELLKDIDAAQMVALQTHAEMILLKSDDFFEDKKFSVNVKDDSGRMVISLTTVMTLDPTPDPTIPPET